MLEQDKSFHISPFLLSVFTGFFLFHLVLSKIPLGSKLSVEENNSWVSPIGDFAIGFFNHSDQPNQYGVGIRFNSKSIPVGKQTVVWVAGAEITVGNKSYFQLSQGGELVLVDSLKGVMWTSKTSRSAVVSALLRDDGNLVLLDEMGSVVWQSFDNPSDTILPGQSLSIYKTLRAASKNSVSSYYSLYMNASGQLQLRWESDVMYWTSGNPSMSNLSAVLTSDGILQLVDQTLKPMWSVFGDDHNDAVNFRLLRLDVDGNLRMYSWEAVSKSWRSVWQAVENQCNVFATCGEHGVCVFNSSGSPECRCPFKITSDPNSKCFAQDCKSASSMVTYEHTSLYEIYPPTDSIILTSLRQCEAFCLRNSFCTAATFTNDGTAKCLVKTTPYFSGYSGPSLSSVSFIKTCSDPLPVDPHASRSSSAQSPAKHSHRLCIPCLVGAASGKKILVYEYVKNGSVHNYMEDDELSKRLTWRRRLNICLGVARAICYLHTGCREFVSHGTLKCENVVLDKNYEAKVSEFGLGIVHPEASCVREKDVEDVGKMLLILVTGCLQVGEVCELAYKEWIQGRPERVVDNRIDGGVDREELERMLRTAFWCLQSDERMRPSMGEVVKVLEGTLTVDPPPPPCASQSLPAKEALLESSSEP
ncbi:hypothetical protein GH714_032729 [Hevea brasiliensis]|uniref:non-specific serine/threonine protein kinase n=1 Tax=Hevea brasiliensis TaxID=3981 RepID=A0A6A6M2H1_HEVBR|nr:hypothetical protein GH714_032729 [Hevea brasiliensis]